MQAMILEKINSPLILKEVAKPQPQKNELLIHVSTCGVCRTDLHIMCGELLNPKLPLILGHQIVGTVEEMGDKVKGFNLGDRVGIPWLQGSCGSCKFCLTDRENLCDKALYTGYQKDGGFSEYCSANAAFCYHLPPNYSDTQVAPLLCAGLIGYRAFKMAGSSQHIGFFGFGASAHLLIQVAKFQKREIYVFTRESNSPSAQLAKDLGAQWIGSSYDSPPIPLDAAIIFAPSGELVPVALKAVDKGGVVICAGIHMSDIPSFPYALLWEERLLRSVANLTKKDGLDFLKVANNIPIKTKTTSYPLEKANQALNDLKKGHINGAIVLKIK